MGTGFSEEELVCQYFLQRLMRWVYWRVLLAIAIGAVFGLAPHGSVTATGEVEASMVLWLQLVLQSILLLSACSAGLGIGVVEGSVKGSLLLQGAAGAFSVWLLVTMAWASLETGIQYGGCLGSTAFTSLALLPILPFWAAYQRRASKVAKVLGYSAMFLGLSRSDLDHLRRRSRPIARAEFLASLTHFERWLVTESIDAMGTPHVPRVNQKRRTSGWLSRIGELLRRMDRANREYEIRKEMGRYMEEEVSRRKRAALRQALADKNRWLAEERVRREEESRVLARRAEDKLRADRELREIQQQESAREKAQKREEKARKRYEHAVVRAVLKDPLGSQLKLVELEQRLAELSRTPLQDEEALLRVEKLRLEIQSLRKGLGEE